MPARVPKMLASFPAWPVRCGTVAVRTRHRAAMTVLRVTLTAAPSQSGPRLVPGRRGLDPVGFVAVASRRLLKRLTQVRVDRVLRDAERTADTYGSEVTGVHQPVDRHLRHPHEFGDLGNGQKLDLRQTAVGAWRSGHSHPNIVLALPPGSILHQVGR